MAVKPIPDEYHTVTPYLIVGGVAKLLDFLTKAFDAKERQRLRRPMAQSCTPKFELATQV